MAIAGPSKTRPVAAFGLFLVCVLMVVAHTTAYIGQCVPVDPFTNKDALEGLVKIEAIRSQDLVIFINLKVCRVLVSGWRYDYSWTGEYQYDRALKIFHRNDHVNCKARYWVEPWEHVKELFGPWCSD